MSPEQESGSVEAEQSAKTELAQQNDSEVSASEHQADGSNSDLAKQFSEVVEGLKYTKAELDKIKKQQQSAKDKEFSNQRKEIDQLKESVVVLAELVKQAPASQQASQGKVEPDVASARVKDMFIMAGFADNAQALENTAEYLKFVEEYGRLSGVEKVAKASEFVFKARDTKKSLSDAAKAQSAGEQIPPADAESLKQDYIKEMAANRGSKTEIRKVQAKYKALNVPIEQIGFN